MGCNGRTIELSSSKPPDLVLSVEELNSPARSAAGVSVEVFRGPCVGTAMTEKSGDKKLLSKL